MSLSTYLSQYPRRLKYEFAKRLGVSFLDELGLVVRVADEEEREHATLIMLGERAIREMKQK